MSKYELIAIAGTAALSFVCWALGYSWGYGDGKREHMSEAERRAYERELKRQHLDYP